MTRILEQDIDDNVYLAIVQAASIHHVPQVLMFSIAEAESSFHPWAVGDEGCSIGLFQLNTCGGIGSGYDPKALKDPFLNSQIAGKTLATEYAKFGNWWDASWPWERWRQTHRDLIEAQSQPAPEPSQSQPAPSAQQQLESIRPISPKSDILPLLFLVLAGGLFYVYSQS